MFIVPIIPEFLYDIRHPDAPLSSFSKTPPPFVTTSGYDVASSDLPEGYTTAGYGEFKINFIIKTEIKLNFHFSYRQRQLVCRERRTT